MSTVLALVLLGLVVVVGGGVALAVALSRRARADYAAQGELIPGVPSEAPAAWAGAHSPEAKLHRRLGDAMRALRAQAGVEEDMTAFELRVELEQHTLAVDRRLIAAAALPEAQKAQALAQIEVSVAAIEEAAGELAARTAQSGASSDVMGLEDLSARIKGMTAEG